MDTRRLVLFVIFSMSILMLWDAWQRQHAPAEIVQQVASNNADTTPTNIASSAVNANVAVDNDYKLQVGQRISVTTDLYKADIETTGGDLRRLELLKHRGSDNDKTNYTITTNGRLAKCGRMYRNSKRKISITNNAQRSN